MFSFIEVEVARKSLRAKRQNVLEVYLQFSPNEDVKNDVQFDFTDILRINGNLRMGKKNMLENEACILFQATS